MPASSLKTVFAQIYADLDQAIGLFTSAKANGVDRGASVNQPATAQKYLMEAVSPYQEGYTCDLTGEDLLNEVKLYRRFDLFGEGFSWYDCKRWGISMVRHTWEEGGNYASQMAGKPTVSTNGNYGPTDKNNWTYFYPKAETDYNNLVKTIEPDNWKEGD